MDNNNRFEQTEHKSEKNTSYFKVILMFIVIMAAVVTGLYYLFNLIF